MSEYETLSPPDLDPTTALAVFSMRVAQCLRGELPHSCAACGDNLRDVGLDCKCFRRFASEVPSAK